MPPAKKTAVPATTAVKQKAVVAVKVQEAKASPATKAHEPTAETLVMENLATLSKVVDSLVETLNMLVLKSESMAHHIVATEEVLAELVADNGLNLVRVNARIRSKMAVGADNVGDSGKAIDIAASIASPRLRR